MKIFSNLIQNSGPRDHFTLSPTNDHHAYKCMNQFLLFHSFICLHYKQNLHIWNILKKNKIIERERRNPPAAGEIHESAVSKMSRSLKLDIAIRQVTMYNFRQVILTPTGF